MLIESRARRILPWVVVCVLIGAGHTDRIGWAQEQGRGQRTDAAAVGVPRLIQIGGQLKDRDGRSMTGAVAVMFAVYADQQGGVPLWSEVQTVSLDESGRYRALLGSVSADGVPSDLFTTGGARWLGVQAAGLTDESRVLLLSVPYAIKALDAETLGGRPASDYVVSGAPGSPGASATAVALPGPTTSVAPGGEKSIKGGGTAGTVAMFTAVDTIGDTVIVQSAAGNVGVGVPTPAARLDVALGTATAAARFSGSSSSQLVESVQSGSGGAVIGIASGGGFGVQGFATNASGTGVIGAASPATGNNTGVWGTVNSPSGVGGLFDNNGGGTILRGRASGTEMFKVDSTGAVYAGSYRDLGGTPIPNGDITGVGVGTGVTGGGATGDVSVALDTAFTDARYAPTVHGHNVSAITGAATLGANTFTGAQTIDGGSIDLDESTATAGNITKSGERFLHTFGPFNTFLGHRAGNLAMTGANNTGVGNQALMNNTTGSHNTAQGIGALYSNTGGSHNTAMGDDALANNTTGISNTASGFFALIGNVTGTGNTAFGHAALSSNTTANFNTAVGIYALSSVTGTDNVGLGQSAGASATTGANNIYLGANVTGTAGESNTMYLGKQGTQTKTVIAGIRGTAVAGGEMVVIDSNGRLGTAAVAPSSDTVGSAQVIDDSLTASNLAANSVTSSELAAGSVTADKVAFTYAGLGANTFSSNQTINGNISLTGALSGTSGSFLASNGGNLFLVTQNGAGNALSGRSDAGIGVAGTGNLGVQGVTSASGGRGVFAWSTHATGTAAALAAQASSANGVAGAFENIAGGKLLSGTVLGVEKFKVDGTGAVYAGAYRDLAGNPIPTGDVTAVTAGTGLSGGGATGDLSVSLDTVFTDARYARLTSTNQFSQKQTIDASVPGSQALFARNTNGMALQAEGTTYGAFGYASGAAGTGVYAVASATATSGYGLYAESSGSNSVASVAHNKAGGLLLSGRTGAVGTEVFKVDGTGGVYAAWSRDLAGNPIPTGDVTGVAAGSGLTGGGAAGNVSLGLDTAFTDARYAPLSHGHSVSQVTGAATLGSNLFTGEQTAFARIVAQQSTLPTSLIGQHFGSGQSAGVLGFSASSTSGVGVIASAGAASGSTTGLLSYIYSPQGTAGIFENRGGGNILKGTSTDGAEVFRVDGTGNVLANSFRDMTGNTIAARTGANNVYLGTAVPGTETETNATYLGSSQTKAFIAGVRGITTGTADAIPVMIDSSGQLGTISSSRRFKEDIQNMGDTSRRLLQLRPVTFRYTQAFGNGTKPIQFGLVAEEVAEVFPELAVRGANGQIETVHYETLNVLLVNELQQQQKRIDRLEQQLAELLAASRK